MKKFKQLILAISEATKTGVAKYQAAFRDQRQVEDPFAVAGVYGKPKTTYGKATSQMAALEVARNRRDEVKAAARAEGEAKGKKTAADIKQKTTQIVRTEKTAKAFGIPDIHAIVDGKHGEKDVAGVTVVGHEKNGYIAKHQGSIHFRHPDGRTHMNVELRPSANGIAIWSSRPGSKKSVKAIAHIEPKGDAVPVRGGVSKGNVMVHPEDDLNR